VAAQLEAYDLDLDISYKALTKETVALLHSQGKVVNAWTVDDPEIAAKLMEMGVDYITSNILE
jgi:glycerophosphoryl diester phosphodiesterase